MLRLYFKPCSCHKKEAEQNRVIKTNCSDQCQIYGDNKVVNSFYTWYNFFPYVMIAQLCSFTNIYYFIVGGLACWKDVTPLSTVAVWVQIIVIFLLTLIRIGVDDLKRHSRDKEINWRRFTIIRDHVPMEVKSKDIMCGDILILDSFVECPADICLIQTSNTDGTCCIDTSNINGETAYIQKFAFTDIQNLGLDEVSVGHLIVTCNPPTPDFDTFKGMISNGNTSYSLSASNFIQAGTMVTNALKVYGIVCYTGKDRKINLNSNKAPIKFTQNGLFVDIVSFIIFIVQIVLTVIWAAVGNKKKKQFRKEMPYLELFFQYGPSSVQNYFRVFLILSTMISFSMKITFEIARFIYEAFIKFDEKLYDKINRILPRVTNTCVIQDLGKIQFLFTDKTGTLTQNEKVLQKIVIDQTVYGASEKAEDIYNDDRLIDLLTIKEDPRKGRRVNQMVTNSENKLSDKDIKRQKALRFIFCLAVCHTCKKCGTADHPIFEGLSPDEICFLKGLTQLKFRISIDGSDITIESAALSLQPTTFHIHAILPFNHENRYMSVIAENLSTHEYFLFTKGAAETLDTFTKNPPTHSTVHQKILERPKSMNYIQGSTKENYKSFDIKFHDSTKNSKLKNGLNYQRRNNQKRSNMKTEFHLEELDNDDDNNNDSRINYGGFYNDNNNNNNNNDNFLKTNEFDDFHDDDGDDEDNDNDDDNDNSDFDDGNLNSSQVLKSRPSLFNSKTLFKPRSRRNRREYLNVADDENRIQLAHAATHLISPTQFYNHQFSHFDPSSIDSMYNDVGTNNMNTNNMNSNTNDMNTNTSMNTINTNTSTKTADTNDLNSGDTVETVKRIRADNVVTFNPNNENDNVISTNNTANNTTNNTNNTNNTNYNYTYTMIENVDSQYSNFVSYSKKFATLGLQTMGMVYKAMDQKQFEIFLTQYEAAQEYAENKERAIQNLFSKVQKDMTVLGLTGIEDTLQPDVPETIEMLRTAGMKVWMVTGDMKESAIKIAHSSGLICDKGDIFDITSPQSYVSAHELLTNLDDYFDAVNLEDNPIYIVIDCSSDSFEDFINEENLELLTKILMESTTVICARANPMQKAFFVEAIRKHQQVTCAVGDGANDVSMIHNANIGVAMMKTINNQASNASDFGVREFAHLQRLFLIHGRLSSYRQAYIIQFCFYKSIMIGLINLCFNFWNGFSSIMYFSNYNLICYNCLFTLLPSIFFVLDKDVEDDTVLLHPYLYSDSRNRTYCNSRTMFCWAVKAIYQSIIIVVIVHFSLNLNSIALADGSSISLAETEQTVYSALVLNVLFTATFDTLQFTSLNFIFIWGMWALYIILMIIANVSPDFETVGDMYLTVWRAISNPMLWMVTITATSFSVIPILFVHSLLGSFLPTRAQKLRYREIKIQSKFMPPYYVLKNDVIEDFDISETIWDKSPHLGTVLVALCSKKNI